MKKRILILGAAGRDFHNFNTIYKNNKNIKIVAFTATQIPDIAGRKYPASLSGRLYPKGIPILDEKNLDKLIKEKKIDECVLSYSDLSYSYVMHLASGVIAAGAQFSMLGAGQTMLVSKKPVIAIVAVRTGCGKSQTARKVVEILRESGKKVAIVRHPMPYGDLENQKVQRFKKIDDFHKHKCTIEEMEEYEPHLVKGTIVFAGVDYQAILKKTQKEADVIVWDGGNNDIPFFQPDLIITVVDPLRAGHEISYYPGEVNFRMADIIIINKIDSASKEQLKIVLENINKYNPKAKIIKTDSVITVDNPKLIKGKSVLAVEDGPTLTHGGMKIGAAAVACKRLKAKKLVDPRKFAVGGIKDTFKKYPDIGVLLPAIGYGYKQMKDLQTTINKTKCQSVVIGTPINLQRFIKINKPTTRVKYELSDKAVLQLKSFLKKRKII